jgi:hypothetical protein
MLQALPLNPVTHYAVIYRGGSKMITQRLGGGCVEVVEASTVTNITREGISLDEPGGEADRLRAIEELLQALPPNELLLQWAHENRPPQSWFEEDEGLL